MTGDSSPRQPRRRGYRRATGGTAPAGSPDRPAAPSAGTPDRAPDDTDLGWNEPQSDDDERIRREKPPHW